MDRVQQTEDSKKAIASKILNFDFGDDFSQETIHYAQIVYLSSESFNIQALIQGYKRCPEIVLDTITMLFDNPEYASLSSFPLSVFASHLSTGTFDSIKLIEALSERRPDFFVDLLYLIAFKSDESTSRYFSNISILLGFKACRSVFEDRSLWGLDRSRSGFYTKEDIRILSRLRDEGVSILSHARSAGYKLPFFLQSAFSLVEGFDDSTILSDSELISIRNTINHLYDCIFPLLSNNTIKNNFCDLIENAYSQDRVKLNFDRDENCTDSFCYTLTLLLIRVSKGILNSEFIHKIDIKKFPTFCFFNISRMMEISMCKLIEDMRGSYNEKNSMYLLLSVEPLLQEYLNFVYDLVDARKNEIFQVFFESGNITGEADSMTVIDATFSDQKATCVKDILRDTSFISSVLTVQACLTCKKISRTALTLLSIVFAYKNTFKSEALNVLKRSDLPLPNVLIKRLVIHYADKSGSHVYGDRVLIHEIIGGTAIEPSADSLRMVGFALSTVEEILSSIFDGISKINEHRARCKQLEETLAGDDESLALSEDEENVNMIPDNLLRMLQRLSREEFIEFVRKLAKEPNLESEKAKSVLEDIEKQLRFMNNPFKIKVYKKIKLYTARKERECNYITGSSQYLQNVLGFLGNFTKINKRLFLNRNIFARMFSIVNSALDMLVGEKSRKIKIQKKDDFEFSPKETLRMILVIILNVLGTREKLIQSSGLNKELFEKGIEIVRLKQVLSEGYISDLEAILRKIPEVTSTWIDEDIPEDFIDPLTFMMMENPVILLTSKITVDRSTFNQIMLNDRTDPFSRLPIDESTIKENVELKERIKEYRMNQSG